MSLDLALVAVLCLLGWQLRREWVWAHAREQALWHAKINPVRQAPLPPLAKVAPLTAASYAEIAMMNLFSRDRNPQVIIDPPAPAPVKPVPAFPVARGVMLWDGAPPTVVLSDRPGGLQKGYHPGDKIGEWKINSVDNKYVVFEWDGKEFKKRLDELMDKTLIASAEPPPAAGQGAPPAGGSRVQTLSSPTKDTGPGIDVGGPIQMCRPGDTAPAGTVQGGLKKVVSQTPFGTSCRWEPVR